jgi:hypothetical protein
MRAPATTSFAQIRTPLRCSRRCGRTPGVPLGLLLLALQSGRGIFCCRDPAVTSHRHRACAHAARPVQRDHVRTTPRTSRSRANSTFTSPNRSVTTRRPQSNIPVAPLSIVSHDARHLRVPADAGAGPLRRRSEGTGPAPDRPPRRLRRPSGTLRSTRARSAAAPLGSLDQQAASGGRPDRGDTSVNSFARCLKVVDTRRAPSASCSSCRPRARS